MAMSKIVYTTPLYIHWNGESDDNKWILVPQNETNREIDINESHFDWELIPLKRGGLILEMKFSVASDETVMNCLVVEPPHVDMSIDPQK